MGSINTSYHEATDFHPHLLEGYESHFSSEALKNMSYEDIKEFLSELEIHSRAHQRLQLAKIIHVVLKEWKSAVKTQAEQASPWHDIAFMAATIAIKSFDVGSTVMPEALVKSIEGIRLLTGFELMSLSQFQNDKGHLNLLELSNSAGRVAGGAFQMMQAGKQVVDNMSRGKYIEDEAHATELRMQLETLRRLYEQSNADQQKAEQDLEKSIDRKHRAKAGSAA